jgi:lauroyl/myristoyl acyltransferase
MWIADALALLLIISPQSGRRTFNEMIIAFGKGRLDTAILTWKWLSRPFRDFVILKRIKYKREDLTQWKIIERNAEAIKVLRESGQSYIVATGHFSREAIGGMLSPKITIGNPIQVAQNLPNPVRSLKDLRIWVQFSALLENKSCWGREAEIIFVENSSFRRLVRRLKEPGNVVFIHIDAPWDTTQSDPYIRHFAGHKSRAFAMGAARLARLVQRPIVSCTYRIEDNRTMVLEYGTPILPAYEDGEHNDTRVMDKLLHEIETAIGKCPTQYVLSIGGERRWNAGNNRWEELPLSSSLASNPVRSQSPSS